MHGLHACAWWLLRTRPPPRALAHLARLARRFAPLDKEAALRHAMELDGFGTCLSRALAVAVELVAIYTFLFVILSMQDYALLFGTAGLFLALALVMFATRNIDWYARDEGK